MTAQSPARVEVRDLLAELNDAVPTLTPRGHVVLAAALERALRRVADLRRRPDPTPDAVTPPANTATHNGSPAAI